MKSKPFNNQFSTQKLREEYSPQYYVMYNSGYGQGEGIANEGKPFKSKKDAEKYVEEKNKNKGGGFIKFKQSYYVVGPNHKKYEQAKKLADKEKQGRKEEVEENSVTGAGEAYLPGLDVSNKKYTGPKESKLDKPYKKVKGFRPGHTEDTGGFQYDDLWDLNENYSRFKRETKTRTNEQQLHAAMRLAEKKIHEANRILEYTSQLRTELTETKVNKNTQRLMEKITRGIAEAYGKMKKMK